MPERKPKPKTGSASSAAGDELARGKKPEVGASTAVAVAPADEARKFAPTRDQPLWEIIKLRSKDVAFDNYQKFLDAVFGCEGADEPSGRPGERVEICRGDDSAVSLRRTDAYEVLKVATECFLMTQCGKLDDTAGVDLDEETLRKYREEYLQKLVAEEPKNNVLPYLKTVRERLAGLDVKEFGRDRDECATEKADYFCYGILRSRITCPCLIELIWSYWHEEGMLVRSMQAISMRFQNRRAKGMRNPLANFALDPLRPLNNLLWGHIEDERHRLTVTRRLYEYDHEYGLRLGGRGGPDFRPVDSRSQMLASFHTLLHVAAGYYKDADDLQRRPDPFPVLNALRDLHMVLAHGAHNQFGDLPWQARVEMMVMQYLLARPEMRSFLGSRVMVAYREPWMDRVESMKRLQGWSDVSISHFHELAVTGEQLLLSVRYGDWNASEVSSDSAHHWALAFRDQVQRYLHSYRAATGVDLSDTGPGKKINAVQPGLLIARRAQAQRKTA